MNKKLALIIGLSLIGSPGFADCPEQPKTVALKVDTVRGDEYGLVKVTMSGFPPGGWRVKCSVRDVDGKYIAARDDDGFPNSPIIGPAYTMAIGVDKRDSSRAADAECVAIPAGINPLQRMLKPNE